MKNVLKIVFLGVIGFSLLVYLTAPKNIEQTTQFEDSHSVVTIDSIPRYFELIGKSPYTKFETLFQEGAEKYIIVLNHDALAVFKELYKKTDKNIVLIANISNTPWLIKQIAVNGELEKMYKDSKIPLINDDSGSFVKALKINNNKQNQYFAFKLNSDGTIIKVTEGSVKLGALEKGLTSDELEKDLTEILKIF
ncbi:hypothetical protein [Arcobacter sp. s6]|jgi:hypothetical protein|uniref:hypothetical protein n=1 Tax=Arcobacter sp. s6 TaxID=3230363 RepID=UPI0034A04675